MTNYEKIKSMTPEEMAVIIMCPYDGVDGFSSMECIDTRKCIDCCRQWLESEAEVDE